MSGLPMAPYEVVSDPRTVRVDDMLYLDGRWYHRPVTAVPGYEQRRRGVLEMMGACQGGCSGIRWIWHIVTWQHRY